MGSYQRQEEVLTVSRLSTLTQNLSGTSHDNTVTYGFSAASQLTSRTRTNSAYDWVVPASATTGYVANGVNQYTNVGGFSPTYDGNGNLTNDGAKTYGFDADNQLLTVSGGVALAYDPAGRLHQVAQGGATTRFLYDGADIIAESNASGTVLRRYVHGPGVDEPIVWYEGAVLTDRRWLLAADLGDTQAAHGDDQLERPVGGVGRHERRPERPQLFDREHAVARAGFQPCGERGDRVVDEAVVAALAGEVVPLA